MSAQYPLLPPIADIDWRHSDPLSANADIKPIEVASRRQTNRTSHNYMLFQGKNV